MRAEEPSPLDRVREVFAHAVGLPVALRAQHLDAVCGADGVLRREVDELLRHHDSPLAILGDDADRADAPAARAPERIGPYRILGVLGSGGMGIVYRAEQQMPRRVVALKVLQPGLLRPDSRRRFQQEAQVLGRLEHPGIARIYDAGTADVGFGEMPYFAMELVEGEPITRYATTHRLDLAARLELMAALCDAVQHAHDQGVVHRDLKPGNVLVRPAVTGAMAPIPVVLDFGIARCTESDLSVSTIQTGTGQLLGTLPYMSPEQIGVRRDEIDARTDVYSLGVILYELLAGRVPLDFTGRSLTDIGRMAQDVEPTTLGQVDRTLRGDVETICARALAKEKARRYASAAELAADLRRHLRNEPIRARPNTALYHLRKFARRHKAIVGGVAGTMLALVAGIVAVSIYAADNRALAASEAELRSAAEQARDALRLKLYQSQMLQAGNAMAAPSGAASVRRLVDAWVPADGAADLRGWEWRLLHAWAYRARDVFPVRAAGRLRWARRADLPVVDDLASRGLAIESFPVDDDLSVVSVSAKFDFDIDPGRHLLPFPGPAGIDTVDIRTGEVRPLVAGMYKSSILRWSPDGARCAVIGGERGPGGGHELFQIDLARGGARTRLGPGPLYQASARFSADGRLLVAAHCPPARLTIFDTATGAIHREISWEGDPPNEAVWHPTRPWFAMTYRGTGIVTIVDGESGARVRHLHGLTLSSSAAAWSPDGGRIAAGGADESVWVWDSETGVGAHLGSHDAPVGAVAFSPDGRFVASVGSDLKLRVWWSQPKPPIRTLLPAGGPRLQRATRLEFRHDGALMVLDTSERSLALDPHSGAVLEEIAGRDATWNRDGTLRAMRKGENVIVTRASDGAVVAERRFAAPGWARLRWNPVDDRLAVPHLNGYAVWQPLLADAAPSTADHGSVHRLLWSPDGRRLMHYGWSDHVAFVDFETGTLRDGGPIGRNLGLAWSAQGDRVVVGANDHFLRVLEPGTWRVLAEWDAHDGQVYDVAWSPDGTRIASGGTDHCLRVWDVSARALVFELRHAAPVSAVAWSADGAMLASCSEDGEVRVADATGR